MRVAMSHNDEDNPEYLWSNNKRDLERYSTSSTTLRETYSPVELEFYHEATAYLDVLRLLNMTEEPRTEYPTVADLITPAVPKPLSLLTTEFADVFSPRLAEEATTASSVTTSEELPEEVTELTPRENETGYITEFKYYADIDDYDNQNYTKMYEDANATYWYKYMEETTSVTEKAAEIEDTVETTAGTTLKVTISAITQFPYETTPSIVESVTTEKGTTETTTASLFTITETNKTIFNTLMETIATTLGFLTPEEEESPVTQIEKTITAEEMTTTERPTTTEAPTTIITTETVTTSETPTATIAGTIPTKIETTAITKIPVTTQTPTTIKVLITKGKVLTTTEIRKTTKVPTTTKIPTTVKIQTTTRIPTTIKTLITTGVPTAARTAAITTMTKTTATKIPITIRTPTTIGVLTTETLITSETPITGETTIKIPITTIEIPTTKTSTTTETPTTIELLTTTEIFTTSESAITTESSTTKIPTTTTEIPTTKTSTTEIPTTIELLTTTEIFTTSESAITTESSTTKIPTTTTEIPITKTSTTETSTTIELLTTTEIFTTSESPITTESATTKIPTTTIEIPTTKTSTTTETPTTIELLTTTEIFTTSESTITTESSTTKIPTTTTEIPTTKTSTTETPTTIELLTTTEIFTTSESPITTESATTKIPTTTIEIPTTKTSTTTETPTTIELLTTTEMFTTSESPITTESTTTKISITTIGIPTTAEFPATAETLNATETSTIIESPTTSTEVSTTAESSTITETQSTTISATTFSTFSTETTESTTSPVVTITTTSPTERLETTTTTSMIPTTVLTETSPTISPIITDTTMNATVSRTTASIITTESLEGTMFPFVNFTTPLITEAPVSTIITTATGTTLEKYPEEYPETSTEKEITMTASTAETEKESITTSIITEETSLVNETVTSPFTSTIAITPTTITSTMITEETSTSTTEQVTIANFTTTPEETPSTEEETTAATFTTSSTEETPTSTEAAWTSTERSTASEVETITTSTTFAPTIVNATEVATTSTVSPETVTETAETSTTIVTMLSTTERAEYEETLEIAEPTTETTTLLTESTLITTKTPVITPEVTSVFPKTASETEFTTVPSTTERPTSSIETTVFLATSTSLTATKVTPEVETEYYVDKALESQYEDEEKVGECDTAIPTDRWYYYDEYESTTKERTTVTSSTVSYTELPEERVTSPPLLVETTTSPYESKTPEFTTSPTISETATTIGVTSIISRTPRRTYVDEEVTSTISLKTTTVMEKAKTLTTETTESTESTMFSVASKEEETSTTATFGSTEEYTLPPSTVLEITTRPLESLTIPPKYTYVEPDWLEPVTKPEEIPEREVGLEKTTSERVSTETKVPVEKSTFVFVSPVFTTFSEEELMDVTTVSSVVPSSEIETTEYKVTTQSPKTTSIIEESTISDIETTTTTTYTDTMKFTTESVLPHPITVPTSFTVTEVEAELITMSKIGEDVVREQQKRRLLQQLDELKRHEKEMAEREERLKEKEWQWDREKKRREEKMKQREEEEEEEAITAVTPIVSTTITPIDTEAVSTESLTMSTVSILEIPSPVLDTTFITLSSSLAETTAAGTEATAIYTTEKNTSTDVISIPGAEGEYDEEIENLKKQLREKERDLEEREKMLLERERRLEEDIKKFEKYMEELESEEIDTSIALSEESTMSISLTTPVPPTEKLTIAEVTTRVGVPTAKMTVTPRRKTTRVTEERKRTKYVPEEEVEIVTKRICLNVLANTTIPYEKGRRDVMTRKICLPYFPEKKEPKRSIGRLGRKILAFHAARKIDRSKLNFPPHLRRRKNRRIMRAASKVKNPQLSHREWLSRETTKSLRHFKSFTRMYQVARRISPKNAVPIGSARGNDDGPRAITSPYEQRVLDRHEIPFQAITTAMSGGEGCKKRCAPPGGNPICKRESDLSGRNDEVMIADTSITKKRPDEDEYESYTVKVLRMKYNEDEETHRTTSVGWDEEPDETTAVTSESSNEQEYEGDGNEDLDRVVDFGEVHKVTKPYYQFRDKDDTEGRKNYLSEKMEEIEKEAEEEEEEEEADEDDYGRAKTSTLAMEKILVDPSKRGILVGKQKKLMDQAWPTEKSTTYHLGDTRYWELEPQVTETTDVFGATTATAAEAIDLSISRTTCLYVVLKNRRNRARTKRDAQRRCEGSLRSFAPTVGAQRGNFLKDATSERPSREKKLRKKRSVEKKKAPRLSNELPTMIKGRRLCAINEGKSKHRAAEHTHIKNTKRKDQEAKASKSQGPHAPRVRASDSCVASKKNSDQRKGTIMKASVDRHTRARISKDERNAAVIGHRDEVAAQSRGCADCICDVMDVITHVKSILNRLSYPLDEIRALNCSRCKETQDKIVISLDSDMEEDARMFPQPRYNTGSLKGQKYIKPEDLEGDPRNELVLENDRDIISLPGLNLNVPCNREGDGITWLSSVSRPSYTWKRADGIALYGFVAENGDLELRNVNAKDTGNYTCVMTYMGADNEEPVEAAYEVRLRVVTLPRYILHGEARYRVRFCDERGLDALTTYLPLKLNNVLCEADICNAYVLTPSCSRSQITMNVLIAPSHIVKLTTIDHKHCNIFCLKAIQDKLSLILSRNLQVFLEKTIIFRLPRYEQRLAPIADRPSLARRRRGRSDESASADGFANDIGLFSSCPAGYGLRVPCDVDTYSEDGISRCKRCPPGTYQPNHGARVCRTCTSPLTRGCHNMLWNSFSTVMVTLASLSVLVSVFLLFLWLICCAKKKLCAKRIIGVISGEDALQQESLVEEKPLIRDVSEDEDQRWEYRAKKKRGKDNVNRKRRKQSEKRCEKARASKNIHEDEWRSHRLMDTPINYLDSYRSHEDYNNHYPEQSHRKGPRLPERDFDT
ncbi:mucin-5AC-like isoform X2 [Harpegnathos saltator]|uniref:mucin-5AC-like isoform X2 n=1 Tax=Harpegnathos saltator TaxID=610380 RepID=UPI000DBEDF5D|nr:mucin-5AC-like isoform X2 [Harpegnathos saltator]